MAVECQIVITGILANLCLVVWYRIAMCICKGEKFNFEIRRKIANLQILFPVKFSGCTVSQNPPRSPVLVLLAHMLRLST